MANTIQIKSLKAREVSDSNRKPTIEVELKTDLGKFRSSVPSGVSTGKYEAVELRDENGQGVRRAIANIEKIIAPTLLKKEFGGQKGIDEILIELDGTENKSRLGANAILAVSMACCRAMAASKKLPLYSYIFELAENRSPLLLPKPSFNMIEGGKHAPIHNSLGKNLAFQEFMIIPQKGSFQENFEIGKKIYNVLKKILAEKFSKKDIKLSNEGAFSPPLKEISEALDLILLAAKKAGFKDDIKIAIDAAASEFFDNEKYKVNGKIFSKGQLADFYLALAKKYPIISMVEDPFSQEDYNIWQTLTLDIKNKKIGLTVIGDDLLTTNSERIKMARAMKLRNAAIIKPNQIGTVSETVKVGKLVKSYGWKTMVANRGGETKDDFIADLAVGIGADFIKSGAPHPAERMAKYNRLSKIEEELKK